MSKKLVLLVMVIFGALSFSASALALTETTPPSQIRIVAYVPEQRTVYVTNNNLVKVASNSTHNTLPVAVDLKTNTKIELTNKVDQQYQYLLALHNYYLKPGFYWPPKPQSQPVVKKPVIVVLRLSWFKSANG